METASNLDRAPRSSGLAIKLLLTSCDIGVGGALVGWFWPSGVMEVPLAAVSIPMLLASAAAILLALGTLGILVAVWSSDDANKVSTR